MSVLGLSELIANFGRVELELAVATERGVDAAADEISQAWVQNIEDEGLVLTGRYRDSISVDREGLDAEVYTDVDYASILEYGDSRQAAHPVAQRALDEHAGDAIDSLAERLAVVLA